MRQLLMVVFLLVVFVAAPASRSDTVDNCYAAEMPGPVVMPDDSVQPMGRLELCSSGTFSPTMDFHRAAVDGRISGLFLAKKMTRVASGVPVEPHFVLARLDDGTYELESYGWSDGQEQVTYLMRSESVHSRWKLRSSNAASNGNEPTEKIVLLSAAAG